MKKGKNLLSANLRRAATHTVDELLSGQVAFHYDSKMQRSPPEKDAELQRQAKLALEAENQNKGHSEVRPGGSAMSVHSEINIDQISAEGSTPVVAAATMTTTTTAATTMTTNTCSTTTTSTLFTAQEVEQSAFADLPQDTPHHLKGTNIGDSQENNMPPASEMVGGQSAAALAAVDVGENSNDSNSSDRTARYYRREYEKQQVLGKTAAVAGTAAKISSKKKVGGRQECPLSTPPPPDASCNPHGECPSSWSQQEDTQGHPLPPPLGPGNPGSTGPIYTNSGNREEHRGDDHMSTNESRWVSSENGDHQTGGHSFEENRLSYDEQFSFEDVQKMTHYNTRLMESNVHRAQFRQEAQKLNIGLKVGLSAVQIRAMCSNLKTVFNNLLHIKAYADKIFLPGNVPEDDELKECTAAFLNLKNESDNYILAFEKKEQEKILHDFMMQKRRDQQQQPIHTTIRTEASIRAGVQAQVQQQQLAENSTPPMHINPTPSPQGTSSANASPQQVGSSNNSTPSNLDNGGHNNNQQHNAAAVASGSEAAVGSTQHEVIDLSSGAANRETPRCTPPIPGGAQNREVERGAVTPNPNRGAATPSPNNGMEAFAHQSPKRPRVDQPSGQNQQGNAIRHDHVQQFSLNANDPLSLNSAYNYGQIVNSGYNAQRQHFLPNPMPSHIPPAGQAASQVYSQEGPVNAPAYIPSMSQQASHIYGQNTDYMYRPETQTGHAAAAASVPTQMNNATHHTSPPGGSGENYYYHQNPHAGNAGGGLGMQRAYAQNNTSQHTQQAGNENRAFANQQQQQQLPQQNYAQGQQHSHHAQGQQHSHNAQGQQHSHQQASSELGTGLGMIAQMLNINAERQEILLERNSQESLAMQQVLAAQRLNVADIPRFAGSSTTAQQYEEWKRKLNEFIKKAEKCGKNGTEIYEMLLSRLDEPAKGIAENYEESLEDALASLDMTFMTKEGFLSELTENLKSLPKVNDTVNDLLSFHNRLKVIQKSFRKLDLNEAEMNYVYLMSYAQHQASPTLFRIWQEEKAKAEKENPDDKLGGQTINLFLEAIMKAKKDVEARAQWKQQRNEAGHYPTSNTNTNNQRRGNNTNNNRNHQQHQHTATMANHSTNISPNSDRANRPCPFCAAIYVKNSHKKLLDCKSLGPIKSRANGVDKLYQIIRSEKISCYFCFSKNHSTYQCVVIDPDTNKKFEKCMRPGTNKQFCGQYHNKWLHKPSSFQDGQRGASSTSYSRGRYNYNHQGGGGPRNAPINQNSGSGGNQNYGNFRERSHSRNRTSSGGQRQNQNYSSAHSNARNHSTSAAGPNQQATTTAAAAAAAQTRGGTSPASRQLQLGQPGTVHSQPIVGRLNDQRNGLHYYQETYPGLPRAVPGPAGVNFQR